MYKFFYLLLIVCLLLTTACSSNTSSTFGTLQPNEIFFPMLISTPTVYLEALLKGKLVLTNNCLSVIDEQGNKTLLIWWQRFSTSSENGVFQIIDNTGQVAASVGDFVAVGGGFENNPELRGLVEPIPEACKGKYFLVGEKIVKIDVP